MMLSDVQRRIIDVLDCHRPQALSTGELVVVVYPPNPGDAARTATARSLRRLIRRGLVHGDGFRYRLTPQGRQLAAAGYGNGRCVTADEGGGA